MTTENNPPESQPKQGTKLTLKEAVALAKKISVEYDEQRRKDFIEQAEDLAEDEERNPMANNLPDDNSTVLKPEICEHLGLKRKCLVCELQEELAAVKAERDRMREALSNVMQYLHDTDELGEEYLTPKAKECYEKARAALSQPTADESEKAGGA